MDAPDAQIACTWNSYVVAEDNPEADNDVDDEATVVQADEDVALYLTL